MNKLTIETGSKQYPLYTGYDLFSHTKILEEVLNPAPSSILIVTDSIVAPLYLKELESILQPYAPVYSKIVAQGESSKSLDIYYECQTFALEKGLDRRSLLIAFGGGVIGDLAGFVAATYMRGIKFIQIPTTLLAHDSAVGGKVAINHPLSKNSIGCFYQPEAVLYNLRFLNSLPKDEWRSGFAELIKHSLIETENFYFWLKENAPTIDALKGEVLEEALLRGVKVKANIIKEDETETGIRAHLNFGHTLGHAIEAELGYGTISHGDAVAIGMLFAMRVSERVLSVSLPIKEIEDWFFEVGFPPFPASLSTTSLVERMKKDKKSVKGKIRMILIHSIGHVLVKEVDEHVLVEILRESGGV